MTTQVFDAAVEWIDSFSKNDDLEITFHGGEPLLAGYDWYAHALALLRERFGNRVRLGLQSNLWLLDNALSELFREYGVSIGTSLDGPEAVTDRQRGTGYYARTMRGIEIAHQYGLNVGVICTFTRLSAPHYRDVLDFFIKQSLDFSVHAAVTPFKAEPDDMFLLSPEEHANLFEKLFRAYLDNVTCIQIPTFDLMARSVSTRQCSICTFTDCLGHYLAVGPGGEIYACNRFVPHPEWQLSVVQAQPDEAVLSQAPAWQRLKVREESTRVACGDCPHYEYCRGGCSYNAVTGGLNARDPHCLAYKRLFDFITSQALEEISSKENMKAVLGKPLSNYGLMRKGQLLQLVRGGPHPSEVVPQARRVVAAVALAVSATVEEAVEKLDRVGLVTRREVALQSLKSLQSDLLHPDRGLLNVYFHITYACNLSCAHCYVQAGPQNRKAMPVELIVRLVEQAARVGFSTVVITGGEPMMHPQHAVLLEELAQLRKRIKPTPISFRTNLTYWLTPILLAQLINSVDQVMVSLDGDETCHDARRGRGAYQRVLGNLQRLSEVRPRPNIGLTATLTASQIQGQEGAAVSRVGQELGIPVGFRLMRPSGRAANQPLMMEAFPLLSGEDEEVLIHRFRPTVTCGLGMDLFIDPDGQCYPCNALVDSKFALGNAHEQGLDAIIHSRAFQALREITVDTTPHCSNCAWRYLCGGYCRAWRTGRRLSSRPRNCADLQTTAERCLRRALEVLEISVDRWQAGGLP